MKTHDLVQSFVAIWNEPDPAARRAGVETLWATEGRHLMGIQNVCGYDELEQRVTASHNRSVRDNGCVFRPATAIQVLPGFVKFRWDMARRTTGEMVSAGVGFMEIDGSGKIARDWLFTEI